MYQDSANVNKSTESSLAVTAYSDLYKTFHPSFQISFVTACANWTGIERIVTSG